MTLFKSFLSELEIKQENGTVIIIPQGTPLDPLMYKNDVACFCLCTFLTAF